MAKTTPALVTLEADKRLLEAQRLRQNGKIDQAANLVYQIVQALPDHVGALRMMGSLAMQTGASDIAIGSLGRASSLSPRSLELLLELGEALSAGKKPAEAISAYKQALVLRPRDGTAYRGLAQAQLDMGNYPDALKSFRKALSILPYDKYCAHMIAALSAEPTRSSTSYVPDLFDTYAELFDEHLTETLGYRVPELIRQSLLANRQDRQVQSALDIGCGTGLVGSALAGLVGAIDGVDISPKMTRKARERGIYRHLRIGDALALLASDPDFAGPYELVTAADVFIYFGPLEASFALVKARLSPKGLFAFSVETIAGSEVTIRSSGRYAHSASYIEQLARQYEMTIVEQQDITIRLERNEPIPGKLYLLENG